MKPYQYLLSILILASLLPGCADNRPAEDIVRERSQERLDFLMAKDVDSAYQYTTPGYRATTSATVFALRVGGAANWTEAKVDTVECEAEICQVQTLISYELKRFNMHNTRPMDEKWLKLDGKWYLYYK